MRVLHSEISPGFSALALFVFGDSASLLWGLSWLEEEVQHPSVLFLILPIRYQ